MGQVAAPVVWGAVGMAVGALLNAAASDDEGRQYLYHFTDERGYLGITEENTIAVSRTFGVTWFSPTPYQSASKARQELALPRTPVGYFEVPVQDVQPMSPSLRVEPKYDQPGGGVEIIVTHSVSARNARFVRIGP